MITDFWIGVLSVVVLGAIVLGIFAGYSSAYDIGTFWDD